MDAMDWRNQLQPDSRQRIVNKIMDKLEEYFSCQGGLLELKKLAEGFEEKVYTAATSQSDYLRKISLKMLSVEPVDWRNQLQPDSRQRIVNKIMGTLNKNLPFYSQEGLDELKKIAERFEERIYTAATSRYDYLRKISVKMLTMETKSENNIPNALLSNPVGNSCRAPDPVFFSVDNNNWRPIQVGEPTMDTTDWRNQLQPDSRQRIVNKIMDTLKKHLPFSGQEGLHELKKIAERFEERIYTAATSRYDYLRKISLKMLTMETKSQNNMQGNSSRAPDPGSLGMQPQVHNQASLPAKKRKNKEGRATNSLV